MSFATDQIFYRQVILPVTEDNFMAVTSLVLNEIRQGGVTVPGEDLELIMSKNISLRDIYRIVALVFLNLAKDDLEMRGVFLDSLQFFLEKSKSSFTDIGSSVEEAYRLELELEHVS
ncbi:MAG: hypothetical protein HQ402_02500 [Parcubacteria group bacterium]|nr:hypothetical protein [Parcubacteria group bacterium]